MIRFLILFVVLIVCFSFGRTQENLHCEVQGGLFRGLENPVKFLSQKESVFTLQSSDSVIITKISRNEFGVKPICRSKEITLYVLDSVSSDTLEQQVFRLRNVPPFELYIGNVTDSMETRLLPNALVSYRIREFVPIDKTCSVRRFTIEVNGEVYEINGDRVPKDLVDKLYILRRQFGTPNLTISIQAKITCSDCISRNIFTFIVLI